MLRLFFLLLVSAVFQQLIAESLSAIQSSLTMEKQRFLVGEPIVLTFTARYSGTSRQVELSDSDPYSECADFRIKVSPESKLPTVKPRSGPPCKLFVDDMIVSCMSGALILPSGQDVRRRVLLNRLGDFSKPGTYTVAATRHLSLTSNWGKADQPVGEIASTFTFTVAQPESPDAIEVFFTPFIADLSSDSYWTREEAAVVISSLAVPFLEPCLLGMLARPGLEDQAIAGLRRLNTAFGRNAIFDFLTKSKEYWLCQIAIEALQSMGDPAYASRLLALRHGSDSDDENSQLLDAAARLDPQRTLAVIRPLLKSSDPVVRGNAVVALAATEIPQALTGLVAMLSDPALSVRKSAAAGLVALTRLTPEDNFMFWSGSDPANDIGFWSAWLRSNPQAEVHLLRECH